MHTYVQCTCIHTYIHAMHMYTYIYAHVCANRKMHIHIMDPSHYGFVMYTCTDIHARTYADQTIHIRTQKTHSLAINQGQIFIHKPKWLPFIRQLLVKMVKPRSCTCILRFASEQSQCHCTDTATVLCIRAKHFKNHAQSSLQKSEKETCTICDSVQIFKIHTWLIGLRTEIAASNTWKTGNSENPPCRHDSQILRHFGRFRRLSWEPLFFKRRTAPCLICKLWSS